MTAPDGLRDRYGAPRPALRWALVAASSLVALVFLVWLGWTAWWHATPEATGSLVAYTVVDQHTVLARVTVRLSDEDVRATCLLRAYAEDHTVVGELSFSPGSLGSPAVRPEEVRVRTERRATAVELVGCRAGGPRPAQQTG